MYFIKHMNLHINIQLKLKYQWHRFSMLQHQVYKMPDKHVTLALERTKVSYLCG